MGVNSRKRVYSMDSMKLDKKSPKKGYPMYLKVTFSNESFTTL
jgi:hypothetical protein